MTDGHYRGFDKVRKVGVVALGLVGADWVAYFLSRGIRVSAYGRRPEAEQELRAHLDVVWPELEAVGGILPGADKKAWSYSTDLTDALTDCDFVQENTSENEALKIELFARMDAVLPKDVLIASSTSTLLMTTLQSKCRYPERCVLGHPFTPTHLLPLVEVAGGERTDPQAVETAMALYRGLGKQPVKLNKEIIGHIANRLASALWREAVHLVAEGVATVADIDAAVTAGPARKWAVCGPFLTYQLAGGRGGFAQFLKHFGPTQQRRWDDLGQPSLTPELQALLSARVAEAMAGRSETALRRERDEGLVALTKALQQP